MIAAAKLFEENSIGMSQIAVKVYLGMKVEGSKVRNVDDIDVDKWGDSNRIRKRKPKWIAPGFELIRSSGAIYVQS